MTSGDGGESGLSGSGGSVGETGGSSGKAGETGGSSGKAGAPSEALGPTICAHTFLEGASGWRSWTWLPEDCSNGLPKPGSLGVGQGLNGAGLSQEVSCTTSAGAHYNAAVTNGAVRCFFADPADTAITVCSHHFVEAATGWRVHEWQPANCTRGLPGADWLALGMGYNSSGTGGQVACKPTSGEHYNHPTVGGATNGIVTCAYVRPEHKRVRSCTVEFSTPGTEWRTHSWTSADCPQGLPPVDFEQIGWSTNGNGTMGLAICSSESGSHYNHPTVTGSTTGWVRCLYAQRGPLTGFLPQ
jgi:hypothetical protein